MHGENAMRLSGAKHKTLNNFADSCFVLSPVSQYAILNSFLRAFYYYEKVRRYNKREILLGGIS